MPVGACGMCCDVCGLCIKEICTTCAAGTDERAKKKLDIQMEKIRMHCPVLACAVERKVGYCLKDCNEFPCDRFESGIESVYGSGPYPYSSSMLRMFKRRLGRQ